MRRTIDRPLTCLEELGQVSDAWNNTETVWYPIPVGLGLAVIGYIQYRHIRQREAAKEGNEQKPKYVANGPWQVSSTHT